jgi:hypothetical protein
MGKLSDDIGRADQIFGKPNEHMITIHRHRIRSMKIESLPNGDGSRSWHLNLPFMESKRGCPKHPWDHSTESAIAKHINIDGSLGSSVGRYLSWPRCVPSERMNTYHHTT